MEAATVTLVNCQRRDQSALLKMEGIQEKTASSVKNKTFAKWCTFLYIFKRRKHEP